MTHAIRVGVQIRERDATQPLGLLDGGADFVDCTVQLTPRDLPISVLVCCLELGIDDLLAIIDDAVVVEVGVEVFQGDQDVIVVREVQDIIQHPLIHRRGWHNLRHLPSVRWLCGRGARSTQSVQEQIAKSTEPTRAAALSWQVQQRVALEFFVNSFGKN